MYRIRFFDPSFSFVVVRTREFFCSIYLHPTVLAERIGLFGPNVLHAPPTVAIVVLSPLQLSSSNTMTICIILISIFNQKQKKKQGVRKGGGMKKNERRTYHCIQQATLQYYRR